MKFWLKNTSGQQSASLTFATIGFLVVTLWLTVSIVSKVGRVEIREFDGGQAMAYLTPLLALYFGRRWTDGKNSLDSLSEGTTMSAASQEKASAKDTVAQAPVSEPPT